MNPIFLDRLLTIVSTEPAGINRTSWPQSCFLRSAKWRPSTDYSRRGNYGPRSRLRVEAHSAGHSRSARYSDRIGAVCHHSRCKSRCGSYRTGIARGSRHRCCHSGERSAAHSSIAERSSIEARTSQGRSRPNNPSRNWDSRNGNSGSDPRRHHVRRHHVRRHHVRRRRDHHHLRHHYRLPRLLLLLLLLLLLRLRLHPTASASATATSAPLGRRSGCCSDRRGAGNGCDGEHGDCDQHCCSAHDLRALHTLNSSDVSPADTRAD